MKKSFLLLLFVFLTAAGVVHANEIRKETMVSQRKNRSYYLYAPPNLDPSAQHPMIVVLHGSGDSGMMPVKRWRDYANQHGILIAGPNALDRQAWRIPDDGPEFIYEMVESLKKKHPVDPQRVYLFGHSGGATVGIYLALLQSEYFAAAAIHAGVMNPEDGPVIDRARRRIPFSLFIGTKDTLFSVSELRQMRSMLTSRGFTAELNEIKGHAHEYGDRSVEINKMIWDFFQKHRLENAPVHQIYNWDKVKPVVSEILFMGEAGEK
ncbi:MAG: PHB depolymerase family esterase [Pyrinomonadaceae bacterium]